MANTDRLLICYSHKHVAEAVGGIAHDVGYLGKIVIASFAETLQTLGENPAFSHAVIQLGSRQDIEGEFPGNAIAAELKIWGMSPENVLITTADERNLGLVSEGYQTAVFGPQKIEKFLRDKISG